MEMEEGLEPGCVPSDPVLPEELCRPAAAERGSVEAAEVAAAEVVVAIAEWEFDGPCRVGGCHIWKIF